MKVIVDTNRLQSEELWAFLRMSSANLAIVPDYVLMEAFKSGSADETRSAFSILGQFPEQVVALKGTGAVSSLNPDLVTMADAMVSHDETTAFPNFVAQLADVGERERVDAALAQRATWANEQMNRMLADSADMSSAMEEFLAPFTPQELRIIRQEQEFTPKITQKFFDLVVSMGQAIFELRPEIVMPSVSRRGDHYVFRNCLSYGTYMMSRVRMGARNWKANVARNDSIDVMLATYGTYFDGVMTADRLTNETFVVAQNLLEALGTETGGNYLRDHFEIVLDFINEHPGEGLLAGAKYA